MQLQTVARNLADTDVRKARKRISISGAPSGYRMYVLPVALAAAAVANSTVNVDIYTHVW